jgi:hypothetical protein
MASMKEKKARKKYEKVKKTSKLGSGKRFSALKESIEASGKSSESAGAIAASIGRKKYGKKKMTKMGTKGRKKSSNSIDYMNNK